MDNSHNSYSSVEKEEKLRKVIKVILINVKIKFSPPKGEFLKILEATKRKLLK